MAKWCNKWFSYLASIEYKGKHMIFNLHIKYTESRLKLSSIFRMEIGGNLCNLTFNTYAFYPMTFYVLCIRRKHIWMFIIYLQWGEKKKWKNGQNVTERLKTAEMLYHKGGKLKEKRRGKWGKWSLAFSNQSFRPCSLVRFQNNLAMISRLVYFSSKIGSIKLLWK